MCRLVGCNANQGDAFHVNLSCCWFLGYKRLMKDQEEAFLCMSLLVSSHQIIFNSRNEYGDTLACWLNECGLSVSSSARAIDSMHQKRLRKRGCHGHCRAGKRPTTIAVFRGILKTGKESEILSQACEKARSACQVSLLYSFLV